MPYPGMMTTVEAFSSSCAASSGVALFAVRCSTCPATACNLTERAEQHVGERAVHRLAHHDRQNQARGAVERAGGDEQLVLHHEAHRHRGEPRVRIEQRDDRRHVGAADRQHEQHAEQRARATISAGNRNVRLGSIISSTAMTTAAPSSVKLMTFWPSIHDRPRRNHFLQLARGDQAAGARQVAENHFERDRAHAERRQLAVLGPEVVLRRADEARREAAERVRQRRPLRNGGERHPRQRNAGERSQHERNRDPAVADDQRMHQRADDRERHAADAGKHPAARGHRIAHPLEREDEERGRDEIDQLDELIDHLAPP